MCATIIYRRSLSRDICLTREDNLAKALNMHVQHRNKCLKQQTRAKERSREKKGLDLNVLMSTRVNNKQTNK